MLFGQANHVAETHTGGLKQIRGPLILTQDCLTLGGPEPHSGSAACDCGSAGINTLPERRLQPSPGDPAPPVRDYI